MSEDSINQLIEAHMGYVRALAARVLKLLPPGVAALDELVAYGNQGLVEAAARFDPTRGTAFVTFAHYRIRGAIFDGLREEKGRELSVGASFEEVADAYISRRFGAALPGDPVQELYDVLMDLGQLYLGEHRSGWGADSLDLLLAREAREVLDRAVGVLPRKERLLIKGRYTEGLTLKEAGDRLGLSPSWCSRLHARALGRIRRELARLGRAPAAAPQPSPAV